MSKDEKVAFSKEAIRFEGLRVRIDGHDILSNVSFSVKRGTITALIGPNGAGKTTLLKSILGLVPHEGKIEFPYFEEKYRRPPRIGYVPQKLEIDRGMPLTVLDFLLLYLQDRPLWLGKSAKGVEKARSSLESVKAGHLESRPIGKLSGGELQRVLLASALLQDPELMLLDEPSAGIDVAGARIFYDLLEELKRKMDMTLILVSHDLSIITYHAQSVVCLNRTVKCEGLTATCLTPEALRTTYGWDVKFYVHEIDRPSGTAQAGNQQNG